MSCRLIGKSIDNWHDKGGHEVDVLVEKGRLLAVEAKSGATVSKIPSGGAVLERPGGRRSRGIVGGVRGDEEQQRSEAYVLPWRHIASLARAA